MKKKSQGPVESACYTATRFLGRTTRSIRDGFYNLFPFMKPEEKEYIEEHVASEGSMTEEPEVSSVEEIAPPAEEPYTHEPGRRVTEDLFRHMEFKDELERLKAEVFVRDFQSPMKDIRTKALKRLKEMSRPQAVEILKKLLHEKEDPLRTSEILDALSSLNDDAKLKKHIFTDFLRQHNSVLRQAALRALARYKDEESFSILSSRLKDEDAEVRRQALNCLSWFFGDRSADAALRLLHDADSRVRKTAAFICGVFKVHQSIPALITLLSNPEREVQKSAAASLRKITKRNLGFKIAGSEKQKDAAIEKWRLWWYKNQAGFGM